MKLIFCTGIYAIDETNFRLNGSWIVIDLMESLFDLCSVICVGICEYATTCIRSPTPGCLGAKRTFLFFVIF